MAGNLYVVAAPSGAGKTTLVRMLLESESAVHLSISFTTRSPRPGEQNGREYHFVDAETFRGMIDRLDHLAGLGVDVLHAPGHTEGSVVFALDVVPDGLPADEGLDRTVLQILGEAEYLRA